MARLESLARGGFYPTPPAITEILCTLLQRPLTGMVRALDPCAGEGVALARLGAALGARTYGVELNEERAATAAGCLHHVVCADALAVRSSHAAYTLLMLNAPYHYDDEDRRVEHAFLKRMTPYLASGGVLCYLVPQRRLAVSARYLAAWYDDLHVLRFPDPAFAAFGQIVVLGRRRAAGEVAGEVAAGLVAASTGPLPILTPGCCPPYRVPAALGTEPTLEAGEFDAGATGRWARARGLWADQALTARLWPAAPPRVQPLMPMKRGHTAQASVAGLVDNVVLPDEAGRPHVVKGRAVKETVVTVEEDEDSVVRTERDVIRTSLQVLDVEGRRFLEVGPPRTQTPGSDDHGGDYLALPAFLERFKGALEERILADYRPLYRITDRHLFRERLALLRRAPRGAQADVVRAVALALTRGRRGVLVSGEMGCGKSYVGAAAAYVAGKQSILVMVPPHLVRKWVRELEATVPGVRAGIAVTPGDLHALLARPRDRWHDGPLVTVISRERAKLSYAWQPAVVERAVRHRAAGGTLETTRLLACPTCGRLLLDAEGIPLALADLKKKRLSCRAPLAAGSKGGTRTEAGRVCGAPLWQADRTGPRRVALATYITRRLRHAYDLLIIDELHEVKAKGSAQGYAAASLAACIPQTIGLTGTLFGGVASSLFHLLYRLVPEVRAEYTHTDDLRWASTYGILERITKESKADRYSEDGQQSKRRAFQTQVRERPGVMPALVMRLLRDTAFLRLADVAADLPPYAEKVLLYEMEPAQGAAYTRLQGILHGALLQALAAGSQRLLGVYLQTLLAYPDTCWREETVVERAKGPGGTVTERVLARQEALPATVIYPKEQGMIDLVRREAGRGRRTLIYVTHTETRDVTGRLAGLLKAAGVRPAVLKSDTVAPEMREQWIEERVKEGVQCLLTHPKIVQTGLDLIAFPTILFQETEYSTYVTRQASRRSWRIGQVHDVRVFFAAYRHSMQANALALIAAKVRASMLVDGDLSEDGLSEFGEDNGDFFLKLARSVASGETPAEGGLEELFAAAREAAASQDDTLLTVEEQAALAAIAAPPDALPVEVATVSLAAARAAFYAAGRSHKVSDAQLSLFDLA